VNEKQALAALKRRIKAQRLSDRAAAYEIGVSPAYLSMVLRGFKPLGPKVLVWMGWERAKEVRYTITPAG
jgi:transcriptional regulator with XRE-family HTH domain